MEARATAKYVRVSPFKARRVIDVIRGMDYPTAEATLETLGTPTARKILKVLRSAAANGENDPEKNMSRDQCWVCECYVDESFTIPRVRFRARGQVYRIRKRTSHITIVLSDEEPARKKRRAS